ncbi:hypothetical protein [Pseudomonas syringae]|uniref:hypothetical protein n=1 Tax=Pseudomonas syringae TaxID=317 RepID=UPI0032D9287D
MPKSSLADTLIDMANAQSGRNETSRLRDIFPEVERALAAGVSRQAVLDALHQDGFTMSFKTFEKALYRIRKKAKLENPQPGQKTKEHGRVLQPSAASKPHAFAGLSGNGRDKDAVHHSVPNHDRIYDRK